MIGLLGCAAPQPDILLVTLDTTRPDALGVYGARPSPTPNLDGLAASGAVFDAAMSVAPLTLPAHAAILTGRPPWELGLRRNGFERVEPGVDTLAERLTGRGYDTGAFVSAVVLDRSFGLAQGFATWEGEFAAATGPAVPAQPANVATDAYARWLVTRSDAPVFAWVHYYDAHLPNVAHGNGGDDPYLSEVAFMDEHIGQLLAVTHAARTRPLAVMVVGDHGESRGEHGEASHGWFVYRSTLHVPLLVVAPGVEAGRVDATVSITELAAWIEAIAAGQPLPAPSGLAFGESWTPRDAFGVAELRVVQDDLWRYVLAPRPELYAWRSDPEEAHDLGGAHPEAARLRALLEARGEAGSAGAIGAPSMLAALGYVDAGAMVDADTPFSALPDPKDHPGMVADVEGIVNAARTVPVNEGVPILEAGLVRFPSAAPLRASLSRGYELLGRLDDAYDVVAPPGVEDGPTRIRRASIRLAQGRLPEAEALAEGAAGLPIRAELRRRRGDPAGALSEIERGLQDTPGSAALWLVAGAALYDMGEEEAAITAVERSLRLADSPEGRALLERLTAH